MIETRRMTETLEVMIVDDNEGCRDLYTLWLEADHNVRTAPNGTIALEEIDSDVELVIVDRNMPGPTGLDVAAEIRNNGYDCQIIMISSERMDFEISESPVDQYVQKPAERETLESAVERIAVQHAYQSALSEFFAVSATVGKVEADASRRQLENGEEYLKLCEQADRKRSRASALLEESGLDWKAAFESVATNPESNQPPETAPTASVRQSS